MHVQHVTGFRLIFGSGVGPAQCAFIAPPVSSCHVFCIPFSLAALRSLGKWSGFRLQGCEAQEESNISQFDATPPPVSCLVGAHCSELPRQSISTPANQNTRRLVMVQANSTVIRGEFGGRILPVSERQSVKNLSASNQGHEVNAWDLATTFGVPCHEAILSPSIVRRLSGMSLLDTR